MPRDILSLVNAEQERTSPRSPPSTPAAGRTIPWPPCRRNHPGLLGEGSSLYAAGLGTVSLCPSPTYLLQAGDAQQPQLLDLDKLDQRLMYGQILAYAQTIGALNAVPASAL